MTGEAGENREGAKDAKIAKRGRNENPFSFSPFALFAPSRFNRFHPVTADG